MKKKITVQLFIDNGKIYKDAEKTLALAEDLSEVIRHFGDLNADAILVRHCSRGRRRKGCFDRITS